MITALSSFPAGLALGLMLAAGRPHPRMRTVAGLVMASVGMWVVGWWL